MSGVLAGYAGRDRTALDTAVGVLMGRRHCSSRVAFAEIAEAVRQTGIGASALSSALVALASGDPGKFDHRDEVEARWAGVLGLVPAVDPEVGGGREVSAAMRR